MECPLRPLWRRSRANDGLTLIEMVVSVAIVSVAVTGVLLAVGRATHHSADPMLEHQAVAVGEAYLEEILTKSFYDPDLGAGAGPCPTPVEPSRDLYDNVCDYGGIDDLGAVDQTGTPVPGLSTYRVRVLVDSSATLNDLSGPADALRADVRVTHPPNVDITLSGYRARY